MMPKRALAFALLLLLFPAQLLGQPDPRTDRSWLDGLCMVVLESEDVGSLHAAHALIRSRGGRIAILSPPSMLLGWIPRAERAALIGQAGIRAIHAEEVAPGRVPIADAPTRHMVEFFNAVQRGEMRERAEIRKTPPAAPTSGDVLAREPAEEWAYLENLRANGFDVGALAQRGLLVGKAAPDDAIQGNSDRMTGTVTVSLLLVESDGSGADPDLYDWTDEHVQQYVNGVNTGLAWWTSRAELYNDCWVAFFVRWVPPTDVRNHQWREMTLHPSGDVAGMASEIMANYGFSSGSHFSRVDAFNTAQRATYGTDWAYTAFIAYNPPPAPAELTNGTSAFAYLLGPYTFLLWQSFGWLPEEVFTHESGHIFGACDEYADGCSCGPLCIDEPNDNCEDCPVSVSCMMKLNSFTLCTYTDNQVGWQDLTPCASPSLDPPLITNVNPPQAPQGTTVQMTISGSNLLFGAFAEFGSGVQVLSSSVVGSSTLELELSIDNDAAPGLRNVIVRNRDLQSSTISNGFEVQRTTRHYHSASGGNVFPYITAADAATSLQDAMDAAGAGDSVLVESGDLGIGSLIINKGILLSGAWTNGFTQRNLASGKTRIDLNGTVNILVSGQGTGGIDGFELLNGEGNFQPFPVPGDYGGGVFILSSTAIVANCEIHNSQANAGAGFGGGGAVYAQNADVTLVGSSIHDNSATRGGAIYLLNSSGSIDGNTIQANSVSASTETAAGAAVYVDGCEDLAFTNNTIHANTGAENGGGIYIVGSTNVTLEGGTISNHTVTNDGGGALIDASQVSVTDVEFTGNGAGSVAGALVAQNSSTLSLDSCRLISNSAFAQGGVYVSNSAASVRHNLFVSNSATVGGGLTLENSSASEVLGNTFDGNTASFGAGGITLSESPAEVTNNIVSQSGGAGISCTGSLLPTLFDFNLVWGSSGDDYSGCTPGAGSFSGDPLFVDAAQLDYHLAVHSPAIDAGRTDTGYEDPDGSRGDLGVYGSHAFLMQQPVFPQNLSASRESGDVVLRWMPNGEPDLASYAVYSDSVSGFKPSLDNFVQFVSPPDSSVNLGPPPGGAWYTLSALNDAGYASGYAVEAMVDDATDATRAPSRFALHPNVPNPFNPATEIRFELDRSSFVRLDVYDLAGRLVRSLVRAPRDPGLHVVVWNGTDVRGQRVASGIYLYRLQSDSRMLTRKMVVLK
jgi:hypothetical protein